MTEIRYVQSGLTQIMIRFVSIFDLNQSIDGRIEYADAENVLWRRLWHLKNNHLGKLPAICRERPGYFAGLVWIFVAEGRVACGMKQDVSAASIAFEQGNVYFPRNRPEWLSTLEHELLAFPGCKHDDQVDSVSQFLNWALSRPSGGINKMKVVGF